MVKLRFKVNRYYLLAHSLEKAWKDKPFPEWIKVAEKARSNPSFIMNGGGKSFIKVADDRQLSKVFQKTHHGVKTILKTRAFQRLLRETETYRTWLGKEWDNNKKHSLTVVEDITGLQLPNITVTVLVTHPKLTNGSNIPEKKIICWGHPEEWKNYTVVYLWHELLHIAIRGKYKDGAVMHALIELATDNELRIRLNQRGEYFREKGDEIGHPGLRKLEEKILPVWKRYLHGKLNAQNILDLEKLLRKR